MFEDGKFLYGGPFLTESQGSQRNIKNILDRNNMSLSKLEKMQQYYMELPVASTNEILSILELLEKYLELDKINIEFINGSLKEFNDQYQDKEFLKDRMKYYEKIYVAENKLMEAVSLGDAKKALKYMEEIDLSRLGIVQRDYLDYHKNSYSILNTLLRKSIEKAGVHPYYLNKISRYFAAKIVNNTEVDQFTSLQLDMISKYCEYARKYRLNTYSTIINQAINYIHINIHNKLSTKEIAKYLCINSSYLSFSFKKEVGITITEYIYKKKIEIAEKLLKESHLQINEICAYIGIFDANYFSKLFKKYTGKSPREVKYLE